MAFMSSCRIHKIVVRTAPQIEMDRIIVKTFDLISWGYIAIVRKIP
jgi:hypothetical protein